MCVCECARRRVRRGSKRTSVNGDDQILGKTQRRLHRCEKIDPPKLAMCPRNYLSFRRHIGKTNVTLSVGTTLLSRCVDTCSDAILGETNSGYRACDARVYGTLEHFSCVSRPPGTKLRDLARVIFDAGDCYLIHGNSPMTRVTVQ